MIDRKTAPLSLPFLPFEIKQVKSTVLENGVPVHFLQSGSQTILKLEFVFKAGSWLENLNGLSHLSAKMLSEGTRFHKAKEIADTVATYGAFFEIHQGYENVNLTFYTLEKHFSNLLPVIEEIIISSIFPVEELQNLKNITTQAIIVNKEKSQYVASIEFKKVLFGAEHPYGRHYDELDIDKIDRDNIANFAKNYFCLANMEVFISGQFTLENTIKLLNRFIGKHDVLGIRQVLPNCEVKSSKGDLVLIEKDGAMQSSIRVGCHSIPRKHPDYLALQVANELLGGFFGSRLMKNIREDKGYTYGIHSSIQPITNGAHFVIATDVKKENTEDTLNEIEKEISTLRHQFVPDEELATVKAYILGRFMNSINTPFSLMDKFKTLHYSGLDYHYYQEYVNNIKNVSSKTILDVVTKYMDFKTFTKVVVGGLKK